MSEPVSICWIFPGGRGKAPSEDRPRFPSAEGWAVGSGLLVAGIGYLVVKGLLLLKVEPRCYWERPTQSRCKSHRRRRAAIAEKRNKDVPGISTWWLALSKFSPVEFLSDKSRTISDELS